ncbi:MAG: SDR family NAD(P)-dependent oxidoreductase [Acidimicrobiales bacterium]
MVGLIGLPHNVAYSMSKSAVRSFSEGLRSELISSGIGLTVVFPAPSTPTSRRRRAAPRPERLAKLGARLAPLVLRPPSSVAKAIVRGIEHDRARVVVAPDAHVVSAISRILPGRSGLIGRATSRIAR